MTVDISAARSVLTQFAGDFKAVGADATATERGIELAFAGPEAGANAALANALLLQEVHGVPVVLPKGIEGKPTADAVLGALQRFPEVAEAHPFHFDMTSNLTVVPKPGDALGTTRGRANHLADILRESVEMDPYASPIVISEHGGAGGGFGGGGFA